jgi:hypothetical protein
MKDPAHFFVFLDTIARAAFSSFFRFFVLVIVDSLRFKNRKKDRCFFIPKAVICCVLLISSVAHGVYDDLSLFGLPRVAADNIEGGLRWTELYLNFFYLIWVSICIGLAIFANDATEQFKRMMYLLTGGAAATTVAVIEYLFGFFPGLKHTALHFAISFGIKNLYVLLMAYFHWPYAIKRDQRFGDIAANNSDFFGGGDSNGGQVGEAAVSVS